MQRAKRFIERHAFERLAIADIAAEWVFALQRAAAFRAATGRTPYHTVAVRLEHAKRLLAKLHASIDVIAKTVGFDDLGHSRAGSARARTNADSNRCAHR